ncbi:MAG: thiol protease/hemagglutinin PrtT [Muribaculaceae bacterium]|nr:thiol protease/hemagglutinin PrtT [Muribaculaceae bacterium]
MRKFTTLASTWLLTCFSLSAASITPEQALQRLEGSLPTRSSNFADLKYAKTISLSNGEPGLYVFENNAAPGYAILSADDLAAPLLGYSDSGIFDRNSMSPEMQWWLEEYTRQIEYARMMGAKPYENMSTRADKEAIKPLITTKWNQNPPYNLMTPEVNERHCVTGCVATAMAQVMKYWNYPETGKGTGECTVRNYDGTINATESMALDEQKFDWNNMIYSYEDYFTEEQASAVAYLMKACGYATNMKYGLEESSTSVIYLAIALVNNFDYNKNLQYCQRSYYGASEWSDLIYEELEAGRPVVYGGQSTSAGHCFICDGYDTNGYFHFNWGWGGMSDGYYLLDALNPTSLGIGANGGSYNFGQAIVIGIQPTEGKEYAPNFVQQGNMQGSVNGSTVTLTASGQYGGWHNMDIKALTIDVGIMIEPVAPTTGETTYVEIMKNQTLPTSRYWNQISFAVPTSLTDGTYRITLCFRPVGVEEWTPVLCESDCYNCIELIKDGSNYTIQENERALPAILDAEFLTPLYYGDAVKMSVTVTNPAEKEITNYFYPALYSGGMPQMIGDGVTITLAPGETVKKEFICIFERLAGVWPPTVETEYQLYFYDPASEGNSYEHLNVYSGFSRDVTMKIDDFAIDLSVEDFVIDGCETYHENGLTFYDVTDATSIPFVMTIVNNAEYFAKQVNLVIFPYIPGQSVQNVAFETFSPLALLTKGESAELNVNVNFAAGEIGKSYFAVPYVGNLPLNAYQLMFTLSDSTGVESVDVETLDVVYDKASSSLKLSEGIAGLLISAMDGTVYDKSAEAASGSVDLSDLAAGIYAVKAIGTDGSVKSLKIVR